MPPMGIATREVRQRAIEAYRSGKGTQPHIADMFGIMSAGGQNRPVVGG